jgi:hypothetical protein
MLNIPVYQCHKKVGASKIIEIDTVETTGGARIVLFEMCPEDPSCGSFVNVDDAWLARNPEVAEGGYFVEYEDGYTAYSPAKPFEDGYTLFKEPFIPLKSDQKIESLQESLDSLRGLVEGMLHTQNLIVDDVERVKALVMP